MTLSDKVGIVTGAAKGIGKGISLCLLEAGARVLMVDVDDKAGEQTLTEFSARTAFSNKVDFFRADVRDEAQVMAAAAQAVRRFGQLEIVVNNAGINLSFDATQMTSREWDESMAIDLKGAWLLTKHALPELVKRGGGVIVNIASVHATLTTFNTFPYAVAKAGLLGLTRSLALDWGKQNVRVVAVSPGWILSDAVRKSLERSPDPTAEEAKIRSSIPCGFIGEVNDVGHLVAFLASDEARYITGTEIVIDGGISSRFAET
jgi:NAD(P)-dependent dehydrogenase (short-subunit alcohol dehydrogenase family)